MLPVMIFEPEEQLRYQLLDGLDALSGSSLPKTQVALSTASLGDMRRAILGESGITLNILGIPQGKGAAVSEIGNLAMRQNRMSYTLFCLHDLNDMDDVLEKCMRPAGILTAPIRPARLESTLKRILEDYQLLTGETQSDDYLLIETGGAAYRVDYDHILYLEALDKELVIHTERQNITVRRSLSAMEKALPQQFLRCHRSYIINRQYVKEIQFSDMTLTITNGDMVPISRGQRAAVKELVLEKGGSKT